MTKPARILIVEDDKSYANLLLAMLADYDPQHIDTVAEAVEQVQVAEYDCILLDLNVGADDGMEVAEAVRCYHPYTAVIILTGHAQVDSVIRALDLKTQAYLVKPTSARELRERIEQKMEEMRQMRERDLLADHMREAIRIIGEQPLAPPPTSESAHRFIRSGQLVLDVSKYEARWRNQVLNLTTTEFSILLAIAQQPGQPCDPRHVVASAMGYEVETHEATRLLKDHIMHLRRKIEDNPDQPQHIITVRRQGYMWSP